MEFKLIVCLNYNNSIGSRINNDLIFNIPQELKHFKKLTTQSRENMINVLIMGRHTWDSLPKKPLPNRMNFIISTNYESINYEYRDHHNVIAFPNHQTCLSYIDDNKTIFDTTFIIGGISIYEYYLNHDIVTQIICTKIKTENDLGDIFFNPSYFNFFKLTHYESFNNIESHNNITNKTMMINYSIYNYSKISKINPNLIYNKSLCHTFTDSEESSEETESICSLDNSMSSMGSINFINSNNEYDNNCNPNSQHSFYISGSDLYSSSEKNDHTNEMNITYNYSLSSLDSIQIQNDMDSNTEENKEQLKEVCDNNNDISIECNKCDKYEEWTLIDDNDFIVKKYRMEHKMQYLKYYYTMLANSNEKNPNYEFNINPLNIYNNNTISENDTYYF